MYTRLEQRKRRGAAACRSWNAGATYYYRGETPYVFDYAPENENMEDNELVTQQSLELRYTFSDGVVLRSLSGFWRTNESLILNTSDGPQNAG